MNLGGAVPGEVRGARADVRRLFENPIRREMLVSRGERHAREFYGTRATGLLPAKYLICFCVIYLAAAASSVGVPSMKCRKPTSIRDPKKRNDGGEGISSNQPVRRQRLLRAEQPETDA